MNLTSIILGGLLLGSSLAGHAQATDPTPAPHFYAGLGVYSSSHQNLGSWGNGARIPVQALVGYQWRPRLAVQLGVAYNGNRYSYDNSQYTYTGSAPINYSLGTYTERSTTTSLLVRYTLTRKLQHRFQADLLGGAKFEYTYSRDTGAYIDNTPPTPTSTPFNYTSTYNTTLLSLGASLRYRVVSRLEAVYDFTLDQPITNRYTYYGLRPTASMALGLRYRFGPS
jgi:hypothetical protein